MPQCRECLLLENRAIASLNPDAHWVVQLKEQQERIRGNEFYFDRDTALDFVQACDDNDFAIIGIECFSLARHATVPEPTLIADYSSGADAIDWRAFKARNNNNARDFVREAPSGIFFNFVVGTTASISSQS